jgi:hypothetical protein
VYRDSKWLFYIRVSRIECVVDRLLFDGSKYTSFGYGVSFFVLIEDKMQDVPVCHDERIDLSIGRNMTIFFAREDVVGVIFVDKSMFFYFFIRFLLKNLEDWKIRCYICIVIRGKRVVVSGIGWEREP